MLRDGDVNNTYGAPHAAVMAFAVAAAGHGWTFPDYDVAMSDPDNRLGDHYRKKDDGRRRQPAAAHKKRRTEWGKAKVWAAAHPLTLDRVGAQQHLGLMKTAAAIYRWPGRADRIRRNLKILSVLIGEAERHDTTAPALSIRTLCERTSYKSIQTCSNAIDDLAALGWIRTDRSGSRVDQPTIYRLAMPTRGGANVGHHSVRRTEISGEIQMMSNVCEDGSFDAPPDRPLTRPLDRVNDDLAMVLTVSAAIVYATLDPDIPQSVNNIWRRSGVSKRTVDKWLRELTKLGLVRHSPAGLLQTGLDPQLVAAEHGAFDQVLNREARHELQREGFRQLVEQGRVNYRNRRVNPTQRRVSE